MSKKITTKVLKMLVDHSGKENAITAADIANEIGYVEDARYPKTRAIIKNCIKLYSLPVVAGGNGYYMATSQEEYDAYVDRLNVQIQRVKERKKLIADNYTRWCKMIGR